MESANFLTRKPCASTTVQVDDIIASTKGTSEDEVIEAIVSVGKDLKNIFEDKLRLPFDESKSAILATSDKIVRDAFFLLGNEAVAIDVSVKALGVDRTLRKPSKWGAVSKNRIKQGSKRLLKVLRIAKVSKSGGSKLYTAGILPSVSYGAEIVGFPPNELKKQRTMRLKAMRCYVSGADLDLQYILLPTKLDPRSRLGLCLC